MCYEVAMCGVLAVNACMILIHIKLTWIQVSNMTNEIQISLKAGKNFVNTEFLNGLGHISLTATKMS